MKSGVIRRLVLAVVTLLAAIIGFYCWWQARIEGHVDLSRKLIGELPGL
jgi:hypothetical protein